MCQLHLTAPVIKVSLPSLPSNQRRHGNGFAGHAELSPRDVLGTLASTTELEIHAEPRMDADCYVATTAPMAETETTAPGPTAPTAPTAPATPAKEEEKRVQVGRWEGILYVYYIEIRIVI